MRKEKEVYNQVCSALGCSLNATKKIFLSVGFSAYFCERCATELVNIGIGVIERHPDSCTDQHSEQIINGINAGCGIS
jgi:hypothetical protein